MSVAGANASEAMARARAEDEIAPAIFATNWFVPPGAYSTKNCVVLACKPCGSETYVLQRHHAVGYMCPGCVQANSYA